jgi:hypothetical protein
VLSASPDATGAGAVKDPSFCIRPGKAGLRTCLPSWTSVNESGAALPAAAATVPTPIEAAKAIASAAAAAEAQLLARQVWAASGW